MLASGQVNKASRFGHKMESEGIKMPACGQKAAVTKLRGVTSNTPSKMQKAEPEESETWSN